MGFVILHGTDTMAFSATALSFLLKNLGKPVVFTGAQLPIGDIRTDAKENILTALEIAGAEAMGMPVVPEVCIYFDYSLFRETEASNKAAIGLRHSLHPISPDWPKPEPTFVFIKIFFCSLLLLLPFNIRRSPIGLLH